MLKKITTLLFLISLNLFSNRILASDSQVNDSRSNEKPVEAPTSTTNAKSGNSSETVSPLPINIYKAKTFQGITFTYDPHAKGISILKDSSRTGFRNHEGFMDPKDDDEN